MVDCYGKSVSQMTTVSGLTSPFVCACTKLGPGFLASYVMVLFFMFNELRYKVIVLLILVELMTITV
jgi:hypothetical protein